MQEEPVKEALTFNSNVQDVTVHFDAFASAAASRFVTTNPENGERVEVSEEFVGFTEPVWVPNPERIARMGEGATRIAALLASSASKKAAITDFWRTPSRYARVPARESSDRARVFGVQSRRMGQVGKDKASGNVYLRPRKRVAIEGYPGC